MKKLLVLLVLVLTSCTLSKEEKAEKLFKETLYYPDSYVPLSTRVDSMFVDVTMIRPIMEISGEINDLMGKINECEYEISSAESSMDIYAPDGYSSQYSRRQYAQAEEEKNEAQSDLDRYTKKLSEQLLSLKKNVAKYHKGTFTGWAVFHTFRALDGTGEKTIPGEVLFFCDEKFTTCGGCYKAAEWERFSNILKVVDEADSDEDIIEYFKDYFMENEAYYQW